MNEPICKGDSHGSCHMGILWNHPQPFWLGICSYCQKTFRRYGFNDWREWVERTDTTPTITEDGRA